VPGNPYFLKPLNSPAQFNQATYLNGGQNFGAAGPDDPSGLLQAYLSLVGKLRDASLRMLLRVSSRFCS